MKGGYLEFNNKNLSDATNVLNRIEKKEQITKIDLSNNNLTFLPKEVFSLYSNLQHLNLSNNHFQNYNEIAQSLSTIPKLTNLFIDLENENDAVTVLVSLPQLQFLNGKSTKSEENDQEEENQIEQEENKIIAEEIQEHNEDLIYDLNQNELKNNSLEEEVKNFNVIVQKIVTYFKNSKEKIQKFYAEFREQLQKQINHINTLLDPPVANYIYSIHINHSKLDIYAFLKNKILFLLQNQKLISNTPVLISALVEIEKFSKKASDSIFYTINILAPKIEKAITLSQSMTKQMKSDISSQKEQINKLKEEMNKKDEQIKEGNKYISFLTKENSNLKSTNSKMKEQNTQITNKLIQKAKKIINIEKPNSHGDNNNTPIITNGDNLCIKTVVNQNDLNKSVGPVQCKIITKKLLLEIINDIYKSKEQCDKKNSMNQLPKETLEQHMYSYLNNKYGLKKLIIEYATSIINGIKTYSQEEGEICLFGKIMRNELEENTIKVFSKIKSTLDELIRYFLSEKYPSKSVEDIKEISAKIKGNLIYLDEDLWKKITDALFIKNQNDCNKFSKKVKSFIKEKISSNDVLDDIYSITFGNGRYLRREEREVISQAQRGEKILYKDYLQLLLEYQIKVRSVYLCNFVNLFREVDVDLNGILNSEQFHLLLEKSNLYQSEEELDDNFERLIELIDPYSNNVITFSDLVDLLEREVINGKSAMEIIASS